MNFLGLHNFNEQKKLISRNEGKIKSYQSCTDVRAWSHNLQVRDRHLREWVKRDMPICVLPVRTLSSSLRTMTLRGRRKAAPRCNPNCKSKIVVDSLCNSCQAIKECLKCDPSCDKYFVEEDIYTSHWPCERCTEILKSIKMFWHIITEKIFGISTCKEFEGVQDIQSADVQSVTKLWEKDILEQAAIVKNATPFLGEQIMKCTNILNKSCNPIYSSTNISQLYNTGAEIIDGKITNVNKSRCSVPTEHTSSMTYQNKHHRCTSTDIKMVDVCCDSIDIMDNSNKLLMYQRKLNYLSKKCLKLENENCQLKVKNKSLNTELKKSRKIQPYFSILENKEYTLSNSDTATQVPKPFELLEDNMKIKNISANTDSEMIITLKNCKHESFKHVSLLQILHKTNLPVVNESVSIPRKGHENPVDLLNKVQNKFDEIVKRELKIVNSQKENDEQQIDAKFYNVEFAPSSSLFYTGTSSSSNEFPKSN
ncbi:hypothetical protein ACJJTC_012216 [Scirpophaga incertulas]